MFKHTPLTAALLGAALALTACDEEVAAPPPEPIVFEVAPQRGDDDSLSVDPNLTTRLESDVASLQQAVEALQAQAATSSSRDDIQDALMAQTVAEQVALAERAALQDALMDGLAQTIIAAAIERNAIGNRVHEHDARFVAAEQRVDSVQDRVVNLDASMAAAQQRVSDLEAREFSVRLAEASVGETTAECILRSTDDPHVAIVYAAYAGDPDHLIASVDGDLSVPLAEEAKCDAMDAPEAVSPLIFNSDGIFVRVDDVEWFTLPMEEVID